MNGTEINVAVRATFEDDTRERSFDAMLHEAETVGWNGDETDTRGRLVSFTVGPFIAIGP